MSPASAILNLIGAKSQQQSPPPPPACNKVAKLDMTVEVETVQLGQNKHSKDGGDGLGKGKDKRGEEKEEEEEEEFDRGLVLLTGLGSGESLKTVGLIGAGAFAKRTGKFTPSARVREKTGCKE
jgi:hypothetical protein